MKKYLIIIFATTLFIFFGSIVATPSCADNLVEVEFDFQPFSIAELDEFDGCDECSLSTDLGFTVEIDGDHLQFYIHKIPNS